MTTTTKKKLSPSAVVKRDTKVVNALAKGLSYRQIEAKYGIPRSTAFDISVRQGVFSKNSPLYAL